MTYNIWVTLFDREYKILKLRIDGQTTFGALRRVGNFFLRP